MPVNTRDEWGWTRLDTCMMVLFGLWTQVNLVALIVAVAQ